MVRDFLLDIVYKGRLTDIILFFIFMIVMLGTWFTLLTLGFKILKTEIKLKNIILGTLFNSFTVLFIRPFVPEIVAFFIVFIPPIVTLKFYGKTKWIIAGWVAILLVLSTAIFPILIISPLINGNHDLASFFLKNRYSLPIVGVAETLGAALMLVFLKLFDIPLIPNPKRLTSIDFIEVFIFFALLFLCYRSSMKIWQSPMSFFDKPFTIIEWLLTVGVLIAFYIRKANNQKKDQEYQKKIEIAENKILELTEINIKNQQNHNNLTIAEPKPEINLPDLAPRDKRIIKSIIEGKSNKEIAIDVRLSDGALSNLITQIYRKLDVENRVQLITYFIKNNLLEWIDKA
jgi:DNA-binding CsgD family transcriptional regulator